MDHSLHRPRPPNGSWDVLLDVEDRAVHARRQPVDDFDCEVVTGRLKFKVGPVSLTYRWTAKFTERDPDARVIVLEASGKRNPRLVATPPLHRAGDPGTGGEGTIASMHTTMNVTVLRPVRPAG